jgi:Ala-tRNA(Pro) deacylase
LVLDTALTGEAMVNVHPLRNTATIGMKGTDLVRVVSALGHTPKIVQTGDT